MPDWEAGMDSILQCACASYMQEQKLMLLEPTGQGDAWKEMMGGVEVER